MGKVALLVIDVQEALINEAPYEIKIIVSNIKKLIYKCREKNCEVIYIQHNGKEGGALEPYSDGWQFHNEIAPLADEKVITKNYNSAFKETELNEYLMTKGIDQLIITGMQTEYCIDTTCKVAFEFGYQIIIPEKTNTTFDSVNMDAKTLYDHYNYTIFNNRFGNVKPLDKVIDTITNAAMTETILLIARAFHKQGITWGIGGSLVLKHHNLVTKSHDIDILIPPKDIEEALGILDGLGNRMEIPIKAEYGTKVFCKYIINGTEIDVMSRFIIKHELGSYEFVFDQDTITNTQEIDGVLIPYTSLEDWFVAYMLMKGRDSNVNMLKTYFLKEGTQHVKLLERTLEQKLPTVTSNHIKEILQSIK